MACDSRCSWDSDYVSVDKIFRVGECLIGLAGSHNEGAKFLAWFANKGDPPEFNDDKGFEAIVLSRSGIDVYINAVFPMRVRDPFYCGGSGGIAARAAMLCGKTPAEAVKIALKCDKNSGGRIRVFDL